MIITPRVISDSRDEERRNPLTLEVTPIGIVLKISSVEDCEHTERELCVDANELLCAVQALVNMEESG
jgi:hypothetical protein